MSTISSSTPTGEQAESAKARKKGKTILNTRKGILELGFDGGDTWDDGAEKLGRNMLRVNSVLSSKCGGDNGLCLERKSMRDVLVNVISLQSFFFY